MVRRASLSAMLLMVSLWSVDVVYAIEQQHSTPASRATSCGTGHDEIKNPDVRERKLPFPPETLASATVKRRMVTLKLCVDETGHVERSIVVASSGNKDVDGFYQGQVSHWALKPVIRDGNPTRSVAIVSVSWNVK